MSPKRRTIILGGLFIFFLVLAGLIENIVLLGYVKHIFVNPPLAVTIVFLHNVIAVSLIIIGMSFYVELVLTFLPKRNIEYAVLHHPRSFAILFTAMILMVSILRIDALLHGQIIMDLVSMIMLVSLPHGMVEGYGIYQFIHKTLTNTLTNRTLATIYLTFFYAAILEVGFAQALLWYTA